MNILTLNYTITQLRCRFLPSGIEYDAMINNHWQPVTHKFVEILWTFLIKQQRALVKNNSLSYIENTSAKSDVEISLSEFTYAHDRAICGFFVHYTLVFPFNNYQSKKTKKCGIIFLCQFSDLALIFFPMVGWMGASKEAPGAYVTGKANLVQFTSNQISLCGGESYKLTYEGCLMTTTPKEVAPKFSEVLSNPNLAKIEAVGYINPALAKSSVGCGSLNQVADQCRLNLRFFCILVTPIFSMVGRSVGAERLAGFYLTSLPTSLRLIAQFGSCSMRLIKLQVEGCLMVNIPCPIASVISQEVI